MNAETIKDFLVSLGFGIDEAGYKKFESVLADVTANAIKTGLAVEGAALSVVAFTAKIASGLDNLYWASQRTGATVQGIQSIGYAVSQVGGSVDAARSSLESLSRFVRNNPGAEGFLNRLGVQTRDASGNMRDMATIFIWVFPETDISAVSLELIAAIRQGYLTVKAAGVWGGSIEIPSVETPSEGNRFFGFDMDNEYISGFDAGSWGTLL